MQFWWKGGQNLILKQRMFYLLFLLKSSELAEEKTCKDCRVFLMIQRKLPTCQHRLLSMCIRDQEKLNHSTTSNIHIGLQWTLSPGKLTAPDCVCFLIKTKVMKMSLTDPLDNKHARWSDFSFFFSWNRWNFKAKVTRAKHSRQNRLCSLWSLPIFKWMVCSNLLWSLQY